MLDVRDWGKVTDLDRTELFYIMDVRDWGKEAKLSLHYRGFLWTIGDTFTGFVMNI